MVPILRIIKNLRQPEIVFLILALIFGTAFLFVTPPFQVPDEPNHFFRAYQVSEGKVHALKHEQRVGDFLPESVLEVTYPFNHIIAGGKFTEDPMFLKAASVSLNPEKRIFVDFNNTALYSPACYVPQALGIAILRIFGAPVLSLFYAARIATLLFWIVLVFISVRLIPVGKWLFCFLALLPMSLSINSSLSADVMTNGIAFLFVALILNSYYTKNLGNKRVLLIAFLLFLLPLLKTIYITLALLILILPFNVLDSKLKKVLVPGALLFSAIIPFVLWSASIRELYITYDQYNPLYRDKAALVEGIYPDRQLNQMKEHNVIFYRMIRRSTYRLIKYHVPGYTGVFGWADVKPPVWFSYTLFCCIVLIALGDVEQNYRLSWLKRILFVIVFFVTLSAVFLTQFLTWTGLGPQVVKFIQARYLIPFYPLLFLCMYSLFPIRKTIISALVPAVSIASLIFCLGILIERYYSV